MVDFQTRLNVVVLRRIRPAITTLIAMLTLAIVIIPGELQAQTYFSSNSIDGRLNPIFAQAVPTRIQTVDEKVVTPELQNVLPSNQENKSPGPWIGQNSLDRNRIDMVATVKKLAVSTAIVLVVCFIVLVFIKRLGLPLGGRPGTVNTSSITNSIKLGPRSYLHLVSIEGSKLVVGVDGGGIKKVIQISTSFEANLQTMTQKEFSEICQPTTGGGSDTLRDAPTVNHDAKARRFTMSLDSILGLRPQFRQTSGR